MTEEIRFLESRRLKLRFLTPEIYSSLFKTADREKIMKFFGLRTDAEYEMECKKHGEGLTSYNKSFLLFHLIDKSTGNVLGWCGYHTWYIPHKRAEIGYIINQDADKGKGYMKEAMEEVIAYGFNEMKLHRIEAFISPVNEPSLRLINHFGFKKEGYLKEHYNKNNVLEDSLLFALLQPDYASSSKLNGV